MPRQTNQGHTMHTQSRPSRARVARAGTVLLVVLAATLLTACNAIKGAGQDLQEASDNTKRGIEAATN